MSKKRLYLSFLSVSMALFAFVIATFAWFAVSQEVNQQPIGLEVSPGIFTSYDMRYYTQEDVFRLSDTYDHITPDTVVVEKYDTSSSTWVVPSYTAASEVGSFDGILLKKYDPLIEANNFYNNLIIEIYFEYNVSGTQNISVKALLDNSLAGTLPDDLNDSDPHYLSQALNVQHTSFDGITDYAMGVNGRDETTNLYEDLSAVFLDDVTYPKTEFGDPSSDIDFGTMSLTGSGSRYIYFNFSYNDDNCLNIVATRAAINTYYYDTNNDIIFIDYVYGDTLVYTWVSGSDYTANGNDYSIDGSGNLIDDTSTIIINAENIYATEDEAHDYTDFIRFYQNIKLVFSW